MRMRPLRRPQGRPAPKLAALLAATMSSLVWVTLASAQDAAEDRATSFKAVTGAVKEDVPGGPLLVVAYAAILMVVIGYGVRLVRMQARAQSDLARLERQVAAGTSQQGGNAPK